MFTTKKAIMRYNPLPFHWTELAGKPKTEFHFRISSKKLIRCQGCDKILTNFCQALLHDNVTFKDKKKSAIWKFKYKCIHEGFKGDYKLKNPLFSCAKCFHYGKGLSFFNQAFHRVLIL